MTLKKSRLRDKGEGCAKGRGFETRQKVNKKEERKVKGIGWQFFSKGPVRKEEEQRKRDVLRNIGRKLGNDKRLNKGKKEKMRNLRRLGNK